MIHGMFSSTKGRVMSVAFGERLTAKASQATTKLMKSDIALRLETCVQSHAFRPLAACAAVCSGSVHKGVQRQNGATNNNRRVGEWFRQDPHHTRVRRNR